MPFLKYHHVGVPTSRDLPEEDYIPELKLSASGYYNNSYGIEWMRFDEDCPLPELVKTIPHVAFVVEDIQKAINSKNVIIEPNSPTDGVTVAFIEDNGAPIEFLQFDKPESEIWSHNAKFKIK